MCVSITIAPLDKRAGHLDAKALTEASGLLTVPAGRGALALCPPGECPCGFAAGDEPTGSAWVVRSDLRENVIAAVRFAVRQMKRIRLTVSWMDDPVANERVVTLEELIEVIDGGAIARSAFVVRGG